MKSFVIAILGVGLFATGPLSAAPAGRWLSIAPAGRWLSIAPAGQWQRYGNADYGRAYDPLRAVVNQTQHDLQQASEVDHRRGDDRNRYSDAQGHLSSFDRKLTQGKFDRGELRKSIDKIHSILNKNVLQVNSRDALLRDLDQLQRADSRDRYY